MARFDWQRIQDLFHAALDVPEDQREAFLLRETAGDEALVARVVGLLSVDGGTSPLDRAPADLARAALEDSDSTPRTVGRYQLRHVLGRGGMGIVYFGEHDELGTPAAVKILRDAWVSPARRDRFVREARTLAQLNHPLIARLYDADSLEDGTPYFVMEYVDGESLTEHCARTGASLAERLRLFRLVCQSVQHAHRQAVIHRDIKPSNVLVTANPEAPNLPSVKLLDFGIAKHLDELENTADYTQTALRLMTPAYAAPEQFSGGPLGVYTDVYALGVLLYELLTGDRPFDLESLSPAEADRTLREHAPERPSVVAEATIRAGASRQAWAELDVLCLTALHPDPQRRYLTVEALVRDLDHFQRGEPLDARPDSWSYRTGKFIRRHRHAVALVAIACLVLAAIVTFYTLRLASVRDAAIAEARRAQRVQQFVTGLFKGGDESAGPADTLRVVTLLGRGVEEARVLDAEPDIQADLFETLGTIYQVLGDFDRSDSLLTAALDQRRAYFGPAHPAVARSLVLLGLLRLDQAMLDEADSLVQAGLRSTREELAAKHPELAAAVRAYGLVLQARGDYDDAAEVLGEAARLQAQQPDGGIALSETISELANTHFYAGDYEKSDSLNRLALAMDQELYGRRHPNVASTLVNLGATRFNLGYLDEAERLYRQALEIYLAYYGQDHPTTASTMVMLAQTVSAAGRLDEANALLEPALVIRERVFGPDHPRVATTLNELGTVALKRERLDEAEAYFQRMRDIYAHVYDDNHFLIAIALSNLASVYRQKGDLQESETAMRESVRRFTETLSADHFQTAVARLKLGRILRFEGETREAIEELVAGYEILATQLNPTSQWLTDAAEDLAAAFEDVGDMDRAATYRQALASAEPVVNAAAEDER